MKLSYTVEQFCEAHSISRAMFYELVKRGDGPRLMKVGRRTLVSAEAAADWRKTMENASATDGPRPGGPHRATA